MKTTRDRNQPFTLNELYLIEDEAKKKKDQRLEHMAAWMQEAMKWCDKEFDVRRVLLNKALGFLALVDHKIDKETILGRSYTGFREFCQGLKSGNLEPEIHKMEFEAGTTPFSISFKTNWASEIIAASLARMLEKGDGTYWNNITFQMHYIGEQFDVVVQRKSGKTVKELLNEAEARIKELEAQLALQKNLEVQ